MAKVIVGDFSVSETELKGMVYPNGVNQAWSGPLSNGLYIGLEPFGKLEAPLGKGHVHACVKKADGGMVIQASASLNEAYSLLIINAFVDTGAALTTNTAKSKIGTVDIDDLGTSGWIEITVAGSIQNAALMIAGGGESALATNSYSTVTNSYGAKVMQVAGNGYVTIKIPYTVVTTS